MSHSHVPALARRSTATNVQLHKEAPRRLSLPGWSGPSTDMDDTMTVRRRDTTDIDERQQGACSRSGRQAMDEGSAAGTATAARSPPGHAPAPRRLDQQLARERQSLGRDRPPGGATEPRARQGLGTNAGVGWEFAVDLAGPAIADPRPAGLPTATRRPGQRRPPPRRRCRMPPSIITPGDGPGNTRISPHHARQSCPPPNRPNSRSAPPIARLCRSVLIMTESLIEGADLRR
jgi:hypothetical protein